MLTNYSSNNSSDYKFSHVLSGVKFDSTQKKLLILTLITYIIINYLSNKWIEVSFPNFKNVMIKSHQFIHD